MKDIATLSVDATRSSCPVGLSMEVFGDRWSLLLIRDIALGRRHTFRDLLTGSPERISASVLSQRLHRMVEIGLLSKVADARHSQREYYLLTPAGLDLIPVLASVGRWGAQWLPLSPSSSPAVQQLAAGGDEAVRELVEHTRRRQKQLADSAAAQQGVAPVAPAVSEPASKAGSR